jgi:hypothetical protein
MAAMSTVSVVCLVVTMCVGHVRGVEALEVVWRFAVATMFWKSAVVSVTGIKTAIYVAMKSGATVIPTARANEYAAVEPLWPVVAIRRTVVRAVAVVSIRAHRGATDANTDRELRLSRLGLGCYGEEKERNRRSCKNILQSTHKRTSSE